MNGTVYHWRTNYEIIRFSWNFLPSDEKRKKISQGPCPNTLFIHNWLTNLIISNKSHSFRIKNLYHKGIYYKIYLQYWIQFIFFIFSINILPNGHLVPLFSINILLNDHLVLFFFLKRLVNCGWFMQIIKSLFFSNSIKTDTSLIR